MLREIVVEGLATIERASVALLPGFTAMTGETGAGKSLIADALALALGGKADASAVRAGSSKAVVSVVADLADAPRAARALEELGFDAEDGTVVLSREVGADGRSAARVNGRPATLQALRAVGSELVDLHGQHQHQALLDRGRHRQFLDDWIGGAAAMALGECAQAWHEWKEAERAVARLRQGEQERAYRLEVAAYDLAELEAAAPEPGELERLRSMLQLAAESERIGRALHSALEAVSGGEANAADALRRAVRDLEPVASLSTDAAEAVAGLAAAADMVETAARSLTKGIDRLEDDPAALDRCAERLDALNGLVRKHKTDEAGLAALLGRLRAEVAALEDGGASLEGTERRVAQALARHRDCCGRLHGLRAEHGERFAEQVMESVRNLAMPHAEFRVRVAEGTPGPEGSDDVGFEFSANPGEPMADLARAASGGEASRLMLAIKAASAGRAGVPTLVFDEVDTGLSGRAASATADALAGMGKARQVVAITHLAQIAARADAHLSVRKRAEGGRTVTEVVALDREGRIEELSRLVGGAEPGRAAKANAEELISARRP
jgi:DNA repair protein RecN (Recombination protein N)